MSLSKIFSKHGALIGAVLLIIEYVLATLFYSYANPELWNNKIPYKYELYLTLIIGSWIAFIVARRSEAQNELVENYKNFNGLKTNLFLTFGLIFFSYGTFIIQNVTLATLFNSEIIYPFVNFNLYVFGSSSLLNSFNYILYPFIVSFIFQGFLLNGISKMIGFHKANLATSIFYGFWFGNLIGGAVYCLLLNQLYWKSKNIFYPTVITIFSNVVVALFYLGKQEIWLLSAHAPDYHKSLPRGLLISIASIPFALTVLRRIIKYKNPI